MWVADDMPDIYGRRIERWHGESAPPEFEATDWWNHQRCALCGAIPFKAYTEGASGYRWGMYHGSHRRPAPPPQPRTLPPTRRAFGQRDDD